MSWSSHSVIEIGWTVRPCGVSLFRRFGRATALVTSVLLVGAITPARAGATAAETSGRASDPASRLAARMLADTPLAEDLQFLCDRIGSRPTGSDACERSVDWFVERFRQAGVDHVTTESDDPERPSRHDRAAVEKLLGATGVDDQMKTFGLWDDWFEGKRGRQKR